LQLALNLEEDVRVYKDKIHRENPYDIYDENGDLYMYGIKELDDYRLKCEDFIYKGDKITLTLAFGTDFKLGWKEPENQEIDRDFCKANPKIDLPDFNYIKNLFEKNQIIYCTSWMILDCTGTPHPSIIVNNLIDIFKAINLIKALIAKDSPSVIDKLNNHINELKKSKEYRRIKLIKVKENTELLVQSYLQKTSRFSKLPLELFEQTVLAYADAEMPSALTETEVKALKVFIQKLLHLYRFFKNCRDLGKLSQSNDSLFSRLPPELSHQIGGFYLQGENPTTIASGEDLSQKAGALFSLAFKKQKGKEKVFIDERNPDQELETEENPVITNHSL